MATLLSATPITTAAAGVVGPVLQLREGPPDQLNAQAIFAWGSGGTNVSVFVQASLDNGATWFDCIAFTPFTTAIARQIAAVSGTVSVAAAAATDGVGPGVAVLGTHFRVKYTSTGTYAGGTTLQVDIAAGGRRFMQATG